MDRTPAGEVPAESVNKFKPLEMGAGATYTC